MQRRIECQFDAAWTGAQFAAWGVNLACVAPRGGGGGGEGGGGGGGGGGGREGGKGDASRISPGCFQKCGMSLSKLHTD